MLDFLVKTSVATITQNLLWLKLVQDYQYILTQTQFRFTLMLLNDIVWFSVNMPLCAALDCVCSAKDISGMTNSQSGVKTGCIPLMSKFYLCHLNPAERDSSKPWEAQFHSARPVLPHCWDCNHISLQTTHTLKNAMKVS